jgi:hypothetical protein
MKNIFSDLKVVELASVLAGPAVGMFFAELGADVVKIENTNGGDLTRKWKQKDESLDAPASSYYYSVNWNKKVLFRDLRQQQDFDEVLEEEEGGLAGADGEILLHLGALFAAEGRVGQDDVEAVFFLNVGEVLGEGVAVDDVRA